MVSLCLVSFLSFGRFQFLLIFTFGFVFSCDNSYLAEDTRIKCRGDDGVANYDMCCKTTVRRRRSGPEDFYCFNDKGSPEANDYYCIALADNPPYIYGLEMERERRKREMELKNQVPTSLRAKSSSPKSDDIPLVVLLFLMLIASLLILFVYKNIVRSYL